MATVYADRDFYNAVIGATSNAADTVGNARLDLLLSLASRLWDRASGVADGMWAPIASSAYIFGSDGGARLRLRDERGRQYFLRTVTADSAKIDSDGDGSFDDYLLDLSDAWLVGYPANASGLGEPYTSLDLLPLVSATITTWPKLERAVQITGTWGYAQTPDAVKLRVVDIAHALSQRGYAGGMGADEALQVEQMPVWVMRMVDSQWNHRIPAIA